MDEDNLTANEASECAIQVLQFMVLNETIGIAVVMVALRDTSSAGVILRKDQLGFSYMRGVAAY